MTAQLADIAITLLCVTGLALMGWWFFGRLLCPTPHGVRVVIYGEGDGENLEASLRTLIWLRSMGLLNCPIVIADRGLNATGRNIATRLCTRWSGVTLHI